MKTLFLLLLALILTAPLTAAEVTLIDSGKARVVIVAPADVMQAPEKEPDSVWKLADAKSHQLRLRESIIDMASVLEKMSGAKVEIVNDTAPDDGRIPLYIGSVATAKFAPPKEHMVLGQAYRIVVTPKAIGLIGEGDLGSSYAIYDILARLGCRWYMPSDLGEVIPKMATITLPTMDQDITPHTIYRGVWYSDNAYGRRNRMGGMMLSTGHALEMSYLSKEQIAQHPEWVGTVDGKPNKHRFRWSAPGLADAIADVILERIDKNPAMLSYSLSPDDGLGYDNSAQDRALDAGDYDPSIQTISITDRQVWFCNQIVERVTAKHPDVLFGMLAYGVSTRPPVREKLHPNLIPQIAPITYTRAQPITDDGEPNNKDFRNLIEGWGKAAPVTSYYFYSWFLAEPSAPNPFIEKWSVNVPLIYEKGNCRLWQPEGITNFESTMHAIYMGLRLAWNPKEDPKAIIAELHEQFYGNAAKEMAAYWHFVDDVWVHTPEYAGCGFGHMRRWKPENMARSRELLNAGIAAAVTDTEKQRIALADDSLKLFESFMKLRHQLADGEWAALDRGAAEYSQACIDMADKWEPQHAFGRMLWTRRETIYFKYFRAFFKATYEDAARVAQNFKMITPTLRQWSYKVDADNIGETEKWNAADVDTANWKLTDVCVDTWSALNLHSYMGTVWYSRSVDVPAVPQGKKIYLWIGATDGSAKVYVNGKHVPFVNAKSETVEQFTGFCKPASFDITAAVNPGKANVITIKATREFINELGTGGLLAPVALYRDND